MNIAASALFMACAASWCWPRAVWWALRNPLFAIGGIVGGQGDVAHNNAVTLRANVAPRLRGNLLHGRPGGGARPSRPCPGCARPWCSVSFRTGCACSCRSTSPVALWGRRGRLHLVNSFGEVFEANVGDVEQDDLPRLLRPRRGSRRRCWRCTARLHRCSTRSTSTVSKSWC
jgi:cell division protein FtsQ